MNNKLIHGWFRRACSNAGVLIYDPQLYPSFRKSWRPTRIDPEEFRTLGQQCEVELFLEPKEAAANPLLYWNFNNFFEKKKNWPKKSIGRCCLSATTANSRRCMLRLPVVQHHGQQNHWMRQVEWKGHCGKREGRGGFFQ